MSDNPLSTQMQALINYSNETTGEADTDLSAAVGHLVAGYGGGSAASSGTVELSTSAGETVTIAHGLSTAPKHFYAERSFPTYTNNYCQDFCFDFEIGIYRFSMAASSSQRMRNVNSGITADSENVYIDFSTAGYSSAIMSGTYYFYAF